MPQPKIVVICVCIVAAFVALTEAGDYDYDLTLMRLEFINGSNDGVIDYGTMRVKRHNKTMYIIHGEYEQFIDFDDTYEFAINAFHSAKGNNQYQYVPLQIPKTPLCKFLAGLYKDNLMPGLMGISNLPQLHQLSCPLKKGKYHINGYEVTKDKLPMHVNEGVYRLEITYWHQDAVVSGMFLFVKVDPLYDEE